MNIEDFSSANQAINAWMMSGDTASLTEEARVQANRVLSTPVMPQRVSQFPELVYANADAFSPAAKALAADLCDFASSFGFFGLGDDLRGTRISAVLRGTELDEAPAPKTEYLIEPVA